MRHYQKAARPSTLDLSHLFLLPIPPIFLYVRLDRLPFALASTVNTLLWSVSGVIALKDSNIYIPNLLGLACSLAQLVVIFMYGSGEKRAAPSDMELPLTR